MKINGKPSPELSLNYPDEVWTWLLTDSERFAGKQIARYRWRGAKGGVLPGGFDANSIAAEAVAGLFQTNEAGVGQTSVDQTYLSQGSEDFLPSRPLQTLVSDTAPAPWKTNRLSQRRTCPLTCPWDGNPSA
jgi:hypothetical protein